MGVAEPERPQTARLIAQGEQEGGHGLGQDGPRALAFHARDVDAEGLRRGQVAVRVGGAGEPEDGGRGHGDADAVRDHGSRAHVARVPVALVLAADRIAHAVAEVDARVAEPDAREGRREEHFGLRFGVVRVAHRAREVLDRGAEGLEREDVGDGVGALVGRAVDGVRGPRGALMVGDRGPGFERMAEHIETGGGLHGRGHGARVQRIADAQRGFERSMGNSRFGFFRHQVEDGRACGFRPRAGGGRYRDQGQERFGDGEASAERGVDKIEKIVLGAAGVEVHELGGINHRSTADGEESRRLIRLGEIDCFSDAIFVQHLMVFTRRQGAFRLTSYPLAQPLFLRTP